MKIVVIDGTGLIWSKLVERLRAHGLRFEEEEPAAPPEGPLAGKTLVLTGAMIPYAFGSSDGLFNLGSALSFVQVLPPGVYIAMNGQHFRWDAVRKNTTSGHFEAL
jgi:L-asparaginase